MPRAVIPSISMSTLKDFIDCRQRAKFREAGWKPIYTKSAQMFGDLVHAGLAALYSAQKSIVLNTERREELISATLKIEIDRFMKKASNVETIKEVAIEGNKAHAVLLEYPIVYINDFSWPFRKWSELEGWFKIAFKGYPLIQRVDGIVESNRGTWLLETKTRSRISEDELASSLTFDFQNLFYLTVLKHFIQNNQIFKEIQGVVYNIIRNPSLDPSKDKTEVEFIQRLRRDIKERPAHYFKRFQVTYNAVDLVQFEEELLFKLQEYTLWKTGKLPTYKNEAACIKQYRCEYLQACASRTMVGYYQTKGEHHASRKIATRATVSTSLITTPVHLPPDKPKRPRKGSATVHAPAVREGENREEHVL